jgi:hypothetical protein
MKRIMVLVTVALVMAAMMVATAMPAFAGTFSGNGTNFGQCASAQARFFPPGPAHGKSLSLASQYNPSGANFQCPKGGF